MTGPSDLWIAGCVELPLEQHSLSEGGLGHSACSQPSMPASDPALDTFVSSTALTQLEDSHPTRSPCHLAVF